MNDYTSPIEQLIHSTVRIECQTKEGTSTGSGYFFAFLVQENSDVPCIITNKHVISDANKGQFHLTVKGENGEPKLGEHFSIQFNNFEKLWIGHPDPNIDIAVFPLAPLLLQASQQGLDFYYVKLVKDIISTDALLNTLSTMEEIIMIGYPNGIWDYKHNLPIIRRGITATHPKLPLNGKPEFMIDAACFPGSSGSPVFLANIGSFVNEKGNLCAGTRISLLGTLYAGPQHTTTGEIVVVDIPTTATPVSVSSIPNNLGLVIHAKKLLDFEPILQDLVDQQIPHST